MRLFWLIFFTVLLAGAGGARKLSGEVNITVVQKPPTYIVFCTAKEKFTVEPGASQNITLRLRNPMETKILKKVYLEMGDTYGLVESYSPKTSENISPGKRAIFHVNVSVPKDFPVGNYRIDFLLGTDEYMVGSYKDAIMVRVRKHTLFGYYFMVGAGVLISLVFLFRYVWIARVNRLTRRGRKNAPGKTTSRYYYKK